jgi:hypothetical protein
LGPRHLPVALLLLALPGAALADILSVGGRPVRCTWWEDGNDVLVNPYNSTNRAMTWGVERYPKGKVAVAKAKSSETPEEEYCRRAFEIRAAEPAEHAALARWCEGEKLKDLAAREWERVLEGDPANEDAKKALGAPALKEILRRNGKANPALGELLTQYLAATNPATRRVLYERMKRDHDVSLPAYYLERAFRSSKRPGGRTDDVALSFRSKLVKGEAGARYTMFVPANYDPLRPTPLLVGLHGGGRGGKDGKEVVGDGPSAMNFYTGIAEARGWLVICPTGHSMGGYGSWFWGNKWAGRWAGVGPMAGGGCPGTGRFKDTQTFVYLYHGTDDPVCAVGDDRSAAESMLKGGNDFVYTELNNTGHTCPPEVLDEMAAHFEKKRLAVGRGKSYRRSDEIRSSFLEKPGPEEKRYLGDPEPPDPDAKAETAEAKRKRLLADIDLGGGKADAAAAAYAEFKDAESVKSLAPRLLNPKSPDDVRAAAAKALGHIALPEVVPHLEKGLADENDGVFHAVVGALTAVGDRKAGPALLRAIDFQAKQFDGKRQGAAMAFPDFELRCAALGASTSAAAALADPKEAVARILDRVVKTVFETPCRVPELARAGHFPGVVREKLAKEICVALVKTAHPTARDAILRLKAACAQEAGIVAACDAALADAGPGR